MIVAVLQIAFVVILEVIARDDDWPGWRGGVRLGRVGIFRHEDHALAVGRPRIVGDPTCDAGDPDRLPAPTVEQPELGFLGALARGEEREIAIVRTPARVVLALLARRRLDRAGAVPARHP